MERVTHWINHVMTQASGICLGFIMVFIVIDIVGRLISKPVTGASELAIFSMLLTVYLGISYCEETKGHVSVDALSMRLPPKARSLLSITVYLLSLFILAVLLYGVGEYALKTYNSGQAIPGPRPIKIYPVIFVMFLGFVAFFLQSVVNLKLEISRFLQYRRSRVSSS
ncbi:MAG: TRAP transporter small permease [Thermovirgaceae bacterium]